LTPQIEPGKESRSPKNSAGPEKRAFKHNLAHVRRKKVGQSLARREPPHERGGVLEHSVSTGAIVGACPHTFFENSSIVQGPGPTDISSVGFST
jgi:hypothetical protein